ncbi:apoptosis-associated speck-like protein containing a CARD [Dromiciops gliroides]|uniref:apoptosis-associated speck-like protein containing a CARD n=1 Tax=Dromiciops gliroides TaxID=33562 RepID=UPI001CC56570|nr:apoptosis-associated speck-like protein containing a CARD [Dromiciops gliroides]
MARGRDLILKALEDLNDDEFKKFKLKLRTLQLRAGFSHIPRGILQPMDRLDLTDKIVSCYLEDYGMELTAEVLRDIGMQEEATGLQQAAGLALRPQLARNEAQPTQHSATLSGIHFMDRHRASLIDRVTLLDPVLDQLYGNVLNLEQYEAIRAESTNQNKMRKLYSFVPAWDNTCKDRFLEALKKNNPFLVQELERS